MANELLHYLAQDCRIPEKVAADVLQALGVWIAERIAAGRSATVNEIGRVEPVASRSAANGIRVTPSLRPFPRLAAALDALAARLRDGAPVPAEVATKQPAKKAGFLAMADKRRRRGKRRK